MSAPASATASEDARWMQAALNFGERSLGQAAPNPSVGAILVRGGVVVGRGVTAPGGRPHAERIALAEAGDAARGATLYVTLEPCSHVGASPPCADAVIEAGVTRVVVAIEDPNPLVGGQGTARLRAAGIVVTVGVGADQARRDHLGHIRRVTEGRPCVTLKIAETADGFASGGLHDSRLKITGAIANARVQMLRATHEAIMVGSETALADDPALTVRLPGLDRRPWRVVLDTRLRLSSSSRLATDAKSLPTLAFAGPDASAEAEARLAERGVVVERVALDAGGHVDLGAALRALSARGVTRVFSEGGPRVAARLIALGLADQVVVFTAERPLGRQGVAALSDEARERLASPSRYRLVETAACGPDTMRAWERRD
ncbi:diaminohydroxyphosphoribosylaminopyrimidine deaminase [Roseiarcus fermentans]|uniref:Riboflavin biosynthesis protein RibD n=1 Tax=Roseiarcus fermentans TaxID=1473586 RepID=A0A366F517_9HYPH|nr:bifunctional diaminohydroxyphosphoribosylaminopyrimidine deaminase/5-amino-6-(5-phosphoribosylamino)uracil reductase RibD [Roseiarcus fermentans]RBP09743.1 diaminohydroxyphosphoribosylaminopyrimidine deaminase [Roseiarcus fermentans]